MNNIINKEIDNNIIKEKLHKQISRNKYKNE